MIIYLKTINGIKVQCSENENQLLYLNTDLSVHKVLDRSLKEMKYVILNENLLYPELFYTEYCHIYKKSHGDTFTKQEVRHDITIMTGNLAGIEFMKTYGHYHSLINSEFNTAPEVIEILHGNGLILLQKPRKIKDKAKNIEDIYDFSFIDNVYIYKVSKGDTFIVPPGYGHIIINQKPSVLIFSSLISSKAQSLYKNLFKYKGGAYYVIKKNAKQVFVQNPNYKNVPKLQKKKNTSAWSYNKIIDNNQPIYTNFLENPNKFSWLNNPDQINWERFA